MPFRADWGDIQWHNIIASAVGLCGNCAPAAMVAFSGGAEARRVLFSGWGVGVRPPNPCVCVSRASSLKRRCRPYKGTLTSPEGEG